MSVVDAKPLAIKFVPLRCLCPRHCEERSDEAIHSFRSAALWIASLRSQ
jgi:hypothetical protein